MATLRKRASLLLLSWFLLLSAAGEGLHLVPGCGHYLRLPGGKISGIGVERLAATPALPAARSSLRDEQSDRVNVLGSWDCPICGFVALVKQVSCTAPFGVTVVAVRMRSLPSDHPTLVFQRLILARAPPLA